MKHFSEDFLLQYFHQNTDQSHSKHQDKLNNTPSYQAAWMEFCREMDANNIKNAKFERHRIEEVLQSCHITQY